MSIIHWDSFQHTRFSCEFLQMLQLIQKYSIDIKKTKEMCKDTYVLTFTDLRWICDAAEALTRKIDVDFATLGILVHFLLGFHGWHSSAGEI